MWIELTGLYVMGDVCNHVLSDIGILIQFLFLIEGLCLDCLWDNSVGHFENRNG